MHVVYIHQHFSTRRGATGTRSYEMSRRLLAAGHRVTMICGDYAVGDPALGSSNGIKSTDVDGIRVLCIPERYGHEMSFTRRLFSFGRFARAATRLIRDMDPDLIFATSTPLSVGIPGMNGARIKKVPFVFEVRDLWPELPIAIGALRNPLLIWYARRLERRIYRAAARIIALSPGMVEGVRQTGYPVDRIDMIPNSADLDLFQPTDEPLNDPRFGSPGEVRFVYTGAHGRANGLDAVLDAAVELKRRGEKGFRFVFIGQGGERPRLMKRCQVEALSSCVSWFESIPKQELAKMLPRMDVGLMVLNNIPAFYRGTSPNKFFDYLASGIPVLNNYPGWLADLITTHHCGLVVPPDDPRAFADAVIQLRDAASERRDMGLRGRQLAESDFSRDRLGTEFVKCLEKAYADHHRG
ncbi:MAG: glycosyltransferase family 4 protein [Planctomycetota bacterium]